MDKRLLEKKNSSQNDEITHNKLINEKSPYLLQHAENPVNWYPWGKEAFEKARKENKPIFLSIGYSTCHWCHVMAHESFEDTAVAELMNEIFVSIKVDREERPDIDKIYMTICQMMTGQGGWPLTLFLTPDKKPFFAGTYFPKERRFGRIGLIELILKIKELWKIQKNDVLRSADQIAFSLQNLDFKSPGDKLNEKTIKKAYNQLLSQYDNKNGGFNNAPKFPTPHNLLFLLRFWKRTGNKEALEMVENTLQKMRLGGIYDHIGFGFHRYSTDPVWLVPHFEKMLYDQALLAIAYTEAYQATKKNEYANTAKEIFTYVLRDMTSPEGGFYSAEDADSEGKEGKFYVWTIEEFQQILEEEEEELARKIFNLKNQGNYLEETTKKKTSHNILHLKDSLTNLSKELNISEKDLRFRIEKIREKLFKIRDERVHPHKDDKILADWNGLMIAAFAKGYQIFGDSIYLNVAKKAANFILSNMRKPNNRLLHRYREGDAKIDAYLNDYTFLIWGFIELYETSLEVTFLKTALELNKEVIDHFWDDSIGGFFFTANDGETLLTRQKEIYDGAIPSGNSVAMLNLLRLSYLTGDHDLEEKADILSKVFAERVNNSPIAHTQLMVAVDFSVGPTFTIVIVGDAEEINTQEMLAYIHNQFLPNISLIQRNIKQVPPEIDVFINYIHNYNKIDNKTTAYICTNKTCKPPITDVNELLKLINPRWN